jgi:hypothetical protein
LADHVCAAALERVVWDRPPWNALSPDAGGGDGQDGEEDGDREDDLVGRHSEMLLGWEIGARLDVSLVYIPRKRRDAS